MTRPDDTADPCARLRRWEDIARAVRAGLKAVASAHRALVARPRDYSCSLNLDQSRRKAEPNASRWDYVLGERDGTSTAFEVHPAKASEVDAVIAKKRWAEARLSTHCDLRVARWHWVRPLHSPLRFTPISPKARLLAKNGIQFPVGRLP